MSEEEDVFTLPEYECESPSEAEDIKSDIEVQYQYGSMDGEFITDSPVILNSTLHSEATEANYCESITSCSTGILTDSDAHVKRIIEVNESSEEYNSEEDEEEIFFSENYKQRVKTQNTKSEEEEEKEDRVESQTDSESTSDVVVKESKQTKRAACTLYSHEDLSLKCEWVFGEKQCSFPVTRNKYDFADHVKSHTEHVLFTDDDRYQCQWKGCKATIDAHTCVFHIYFHAYHTALKSVGINCARREKLKKCSFATHRVNSFKTREPNRICLWNNCRESFVNMFSYETHIEHHMEKFFSKQNANVKLPCEWNNCNPRHATNRKAMMLRHLLKHSQLKHVACPTCGDMFKTRSAFKVHCHRQKKDVDLQCNLCKKYFSTESLLHNHVQNHVYTKQCNFCQAMCLSASALATHIRFKHLDGQHHFFKCDECDFRTITSAQLRTHKQRHLPMEKRTKLICEYSECTYTCYARRTLYDHIKATHEGARYICHVCPRSYRSSTALSKHLKKKHNLTFPVGTDRFRYRKDKQGNYRLQTVRYESIENEEEPRPQSRSSSPQYGSSTPVQNKLPRYSLRLLQNNKVELLKVDNGESFK